MRRFNAVVGVLAPVVGHDRHAFAMGDAVTAWFVARQMILRAFSLLKMRFAAVPLRRFLNQDIDDIAVVVNRTPQIESLSTDYIRPSLEIPAQSFTRSLRDEPVRIVRV